jgi:uncharacterized protein YcsI (UPF0317 family)
MADLVYGKTSREIREEIRSGINVAPTAGLAPGVVQTNLAILPQSEAFDFLLFCQRNPKPCPLIEVLEAGEVEARISAPKSDIRRDLPLYRIYEYGSMSAEVEDISEYWKEDFVSFLLGCSFSFESALINNGIPLRHYQEGKNVSMFITNLETEPAGAFSGPMVVSMRAIRRDSIVRAVQVTSRFPSVHGAPIHIGDPKAIGIHDINKPDFGDVTALEGDEVPVFWACGVTPQSIAMKSRPPIMITHAPGHMFLTDIKDEELSLI